MPPNTISLSALQLLLTYRCTFIINTAQHVECVVREETLAVKERGEQLSDGGRAHGLPVLMFVPLQASLQHLVEGQLVSLHASGSDNALVRPGTPHIAHE